MSVRFIGRFLECAAALIFALGVAYAQCTNSGNVYTCTSSGSTGTPIISINDTSDNTVQNGTYPVTITVPNTVTGTVSSVVVVLNGVTASDAGFNYGLGSLGLLLVHAGANLEIMSSPGDGGEGFSSATFYISDTLVSGLGTINAFGYMPIDSPVSCGTAAPFVPPGEGGTYAGISDYRPSSYEFGIAKGSYSSPAPSSINYSGPCYPSTINTLGAAFGGTAADGAWSLYAVGFGYADVQIANWSVIITTANATTTATTLTSTVNPSFTASPSNSTNLTATVSGGASGGTVAFSDGATTLCGSVPLSSGQAACVATFTTEGFHALSAVYSGTASFGTSTGTANQFVEKHTTSGGTNIFCNTGAINLGTSNASGTDTSPYPSVVNVTGISNTVSTVQLVLNTVSTNNLLDLSMLLVSPDGNHSLDFFDYIGGAVSTTSTAVTMADSPTCSSLGPNGSGGLASPACYQPTSYRYPGFDVPPSFLDPPQPAPQVPGTFSLATPGGGVSAKTFLEAFNGATANGAWSLYVYDHGNSNTSSIGGGWCLNITPGVGLSTTTTVSGSPNAAAPSGAATGSPVTITATVKQGTNLVNKGSVSFTLNGAAIAGGTNVSVGTSGPTQGQASFVTSALPEGDNLILATYTDSTNTYSESFGTYTQRVDTTTTVTVNGITVTYCNTGQVKVPGPNNATDAGAGSPNPSNVTVASLFGTLNTLTVTLNGYSEGQPDLLTSLLVGPSSNLDFFSLAGGAIGVGPFNLTFSDAATTLVPETNGSLVAGTYKPSSYTTGTDTYTSSTSGFYTLPGTFNYAATKGSATFASIFSGNPNGNWDLYFNQTGNNRGGGLATGWCLNFVENPPALTMTKVHSGNFVQGQQGAQFTLTVDNTGLGTAGGPIPVTVVDILPSGLTPAATPGTGTGWTCGAVSQTVTCTNSTVVPSSSSFPRLTLNVNVANNAGASLSNTASVNGSGNATAVNSNRDTVTIQSAPVLVISKSPSGNFTQGSTAIWDIVVSNTATANSTTSGLVTVVDTLPSGYSFSSYTGSPSWTCGAAGVTVTCTSTAAVSGGSSYTTIGLTVNVPATSPTSVTNNASAYGGGDLTHTSLGLAATTFSTVTVIQVPASIGLTTGNSQSVAINTAFPINLSATILDAGSVPINGVTVTFTAPGTGASGTFAGATNVKTATTNASGVAAATVYTSNSTAGGPYSIGVAAGTVTNNYSETNLPGPATQMSANAGTTPQSATINTAFANALAVTVKDAGSNPISGVNVTFTAPGAGASGTFSNSTVTIIVATNASGVAAAPFTANGTAGAGYTVTAAASGLTTVNFSLTNLAGAPSSMTANAGTTPQSATINTAFANALAVTVKDAGSNPISGVNVTFTAPGAGASGKFSNSTVTITVTTNSSGIASAPFTANSMAGAGYTVTASAAGLTSVNFTLTNLAGAAASITAVAGSTPQSATVSAGSDHKGRFQ
jgi:hypothetical protein